MWRRHRSGLNHQDTKDTKAAASFRASRGPFVSWCLGGSCCLAATLLLIARAVAAPPAGVDGNSELSAWFRSLQNSRGEWCCSVADCRRPYAWRQMMGHGYQVQAVAGADWLDVPAQNILRRENPIGDAVACIVGGEVRCFVPPSET
jgi:hypothetical protein